MPFVTVLLHTLLDNQGWQIIGIKKDRTREVIAILAPVAGEWLAQRFADLAAKNLSSQPLAEVD